MAFQLVTARPWGPINLSPRWWGKEVGKGLGARLVTPDPGDPGGTRRNWRGSHPWLPSPRVGPGSQRARPGVRLAWDALSWPLRAGAVQRPRSRPAVAIGSRAQTQTLDWSAPWFVRTPNGQTGRVRRGRAHAGPWRCPSPAAGGRARRATWRRRGPARMGPAAPTPARRPACSRR